MRSSGAWALEWSATDAYTTTPPDGLVTAQDGWSVEVRAYCAVNRVHSLELLLLRNGATITAGGTGDNANVNIAQIAEPVRPNLAVPWGILGSGPMTNLYLNAQGMLIVSAMLANATWDTGTSRTASGVWIRG